MQQMNGTLVLMGSGETTPTMVTTHQRLFAALGGRIGSDPAAVLLDTPYGFQENAGEISEKAQHYFSHHVGAQVDRLAATDPASIDQVELERTLDRLRTSDWVFAGPGSPTYAIRQWRSAAFDQALAEVVQRGGTVVLASAAAVTGGTRTIPVYEVYKAGVEPFWEEGLDLVGAVTGWNCVVIPHFDNAEGGTHDTRFCYLGERRLRMLEADLDNDEWILGIDEHTAAIIDLSAGRMRVEGRGAVHVRVDGQVVASHPTGTEVELAAVRRPGKAAKAADTPAVVAGDEPADASRRTPFIEQVEALRQRFDTAVDGQDADTATAAALELEALIRAWADDTDQNAERDRAVTVLRGMVTRLGRLAGEGMHDHRELVRPHVETLLHVRDDARSRKHYDVADHIRGHMDADGVRVKDTREGTEWEWQEPDLSRSTSRSTER